MTNAVLPPSESESKCITRIVDSQQGDQALISEIKSQNLGSGDSTGSLTSYMNTSKGTSSASSAPAATPSIRVDAVILVYDLNRIETFYRLESHWLPLIERRYDGEVRLLLPPCKCLYDTLFVTCLTMRSLLVALFITDAGNSGRKQDGHLASTGSQ